jgi:thiol-disulfide isomerase/thioredoxin
LILCMNYYKQDKQDKQDLVNIKLKLFFMYVIIYLTMVECGKEVFALIFALFVIIYYLYTTNTQLTVYWFYRPGCPHCDNMKKAWEKSVRHLSMKPISMKGIDTSISTNDELASNFGVSGVPHLVKVLTDGSRHVYTGDRSSDSIIAWVTED